MTCRYRHTLIRAGQFRLDAGSMFGLIPRAVWSRTVPTDDRGRVVLQHNCLLLERLDDPPPSWKGPAPRLVLLEAGTGDKLDPASADLFGLDGTTVESALHAAGCDAGSIGAAVVSHLHFDHAGGLTRRPRAGEAHDWFGPGSSFGGKAPDAGVKLTFPNAAVFAQRREWLDALANRSVMTRTYFADHLHPMEDRLTLVDSVPPFAPGRVPDRAETPAIDQSLRETEVLPGVFVFLVPGHTWGQQATRLVAADGRSVVFTPDVMPTAWHSGAAFSLAYDVEPYTSMVSRTWFLAQAAKDRWTLMLDHEPGNPFRTVAANAKGWYDLAEA